MKAPKTVVNSSHINNNESIHPEVKRSRTPDSRRADKRNDDREKPKKGNGDRKILWNDEIFESPSTRPASRPEAKKKYNRSCLRVKTQNEALQQKGIRKMKGRRKTIEFSMLEVREHPIIL
jgi:hypothetical protein